MRFSSRPWLDIFKPDSLNSLSGKIVESQDEMWKRMAFRKKTYVRTQTVLPELPVEVIGVIGEQLANLQYLATLASLNVSCKAVHWETKPILWRIFRARDLGFTTSLRHGSTRDYELQFRANFAHLKGYKYIQYATASPGMLKIDRQTQRLYCQLGPPGEISRCGVTILSSLTWPLEDDIEASILHLSVSQRLFCPKMLQLFDGGVLHRPRLRQLDSPLVQGREGQSLLVLVPSAHSDSGYPSLVKKHLETFLDDSKPGFEPRFEIIHILLHKQEPVPIDPDYLYALTADMNNLLAHSVGLKQLQRLPTSKWVILHIDVEDDALINVIFAAWSRIAFHAPYRARIKLVLQVDRRPRTSREMKRWFQPFKAEYARRKISAATAPCFHIEIITAQLQECIACFVPRRDLVEIEGWNQKAVDLGAQCLCIPDDGRDGDYLTTDFWNPETRL